MVFHEHDEEPAEKTVVTNRTPSTLPSAAADSAAAYLIVIAGDEIGRRLPLGPSTIEAGRSLACDFSINHESVSRRHARIWWTGPGYRIRDLGSTNGTFVNDEPTIERDLVDGDRIKIGGTVLKLVTGGSVEASYHEQIYRLVTLDGLTQLYNQRHFHESLAREVARGERYGRKLGLVLCDIDHFKALNDAHGHLAGDTVLRELAALVKRSVRRQDLLARVGGEELALLAPECGLPEVTVVAEKIRRLVEGTSFKYADRKLAVTVSLGCSTLLPGADSAEAMYRRADEALYAAKQAGRNRVV